MEIVILYLILIIIIKINKRKTTLKLQKCSKKY